LTSDVLLFFMSTRQAIVYISATRGVNDRAFDRFTVSYEMERNGQEIVFRFNNETVERNS
jgi:hypothetical protein